MFELHKHNNINPPYLSPYLSPYPGEHLYYISIVCLPLLADFYDG